MCPSFEIINSTANGMLTYCSHTRLIQLVFKNLCFEFYEQEYHSFVNYVYELKEDYLEKEYQNSIHPRKIPLDIGHLCFMVLLNKEELWELRSLFNGGEKPVVLLKASEIDYRMIEN